MLNRSASLAMSTSILKALPGKLDIKRHSPSILYVPGARRNDDGQTDSVSDYSAYLRVVQTIDTKALKYCFIDNFVLQISIQFYPNIHVPCG